MRIKKYNIAGIFLILGFVLTLLYIREPEPSPCRDCLPSSSYKKLLEPLPKEPPEEIDPRCVLPICTDEYLKGLKHRRDIKPQKDEFPYKIALYANPFTLNEWKKWRDEGRLKEARYVFLGTLNVDNDRNLEFHIDESSSIPPRLFRETLHGLNDIKERINHERIVSIPSIASGYSVPTYSDYFIPTLERRLIYWLELEIVRLSSPANIPDDQIPKDILPEWRRTPRWD